MLNEFTRNLYDGKLYVVHTVVDVVPQTLKYHYSCLTVLYTKGKVYLFFNNDQETHFLSFSGRLLMSKIDEKTPLRNAF